LTAGETATRIRDCGADEFVGWPKSTTAKQFRVLGITLTWLVPVVLQGCLRLETWVQGVRETWANLALVGWVVHNSITTTTTLMEVLKEGTMSVCFTRCDM